MDPTWMDPTWLDEHISSTTDYSYSHKFFCIGFCLAVSVGLSGFRGLPQDMAVPSRCLRRDFPKKVKSIFSYGIARKPENKLRINFDA